MARRRYAVAYDIRDPKRLRQVHAAMKGYGDPLQYSVFLCDLDGSERVMMRAELRGLINERQDSVAIIDLGEAKGRGMECFEFLGVTTSLPTGGPRIV
jgi:CRISPR-associated protein Cas2